MTDSHTERQTRDATTPDRDDTRASVIDQGHQSGWETLGFLKEVFRFQFLRVFNVFNFFCTKIEDTKVRPTAVSVEPETRYGK